jgi:hypothetical protein
VKDEVSSQIKAESIKIRKSIFNNRKNTIADWLTNNYVEASGNCLDKSCVEGYKLIMVVHTASWWGGCKPFKANLKNIYNAWNSDGKNLQVIIISVEMCQDGFNDTLNDFPWVGLPLSSEE